jgi:hypothetical protein
MLCRFRRANKATFTCPFHGWTFSNTGKLLKVKGPEGAGYPEQFNKHGSHDLTRVARFESYRGFLFGSLNAEVASLGGVMSTWLGSRAKSGDPVEPTGPMGAFYLRPVERPQLWLAGEGRRGGHRPADPPLLRRHPRRRPRRARPGAGARRQDRHRPGRDHPRGAGRGARAQGLRHRPSRPRRLQRRRRRRLPLRPAADGRGGAPAHGRPRRPAFELPLREVQPDRDPGGAA